MKFLRSSLHGYHSHRYVFLVTSEIWSLQIDTPTVPGSKKELSVSVSKDSIGEMYIILN